MKSRELFDLPMQYESGAYTTLQSSCCCSVTKLCSTLCNPMDCSMPCFSLSPSLLKLISIELMMPSNHLVLCRPLLFLPSVFPSIRVFSNESALHIRWPNYWTFSFSISPSNEYSGWISCCLRDSQESSPTSQFKSINSLVLSLLYGSTLTSVHDSWKNHSSD